MTQIVETSYLTALVVAIVAIVGVAAIVIGKLFKGQA